MNNLQDALLECYVFVDDYLKANPRLAGWRRSNNDSPEFTDAEVITMALMQGYFRTDTLKRAYQLVTANAPTAFPEAPGYKQWVRRVGQIPALIGHLVRTAALRVLADSCARLYVAYALALSTGGGYLLTDKGYNGQKTYDWLRDNAQMCQVLSSDEAGFTPISQLRQRVESSFSSLWRRFADRIYARSWHGLWSSLILKTLHFNMERAGIVTTDDSTRD